MLKLEVLYIGNNMIAKIDELNNLVTYSFFLYLIRKLYIILQNFNILKIFLLYLDIS